jgi:hypothetical protein
MAIIVNPETVEVMEGLIIISDDREMKPVKMSMPEMQALGRMVRSKPRGEMKEITCAAQGCSNKKMVRVADIKRGWGKFCSKKCAKR